MTKGLRHELLGITAASGLAAWALGKRRTAGAFGLLAAGLVLANGERYRYQGRSVVITGGSRGLGLALASQLVQARARVTILARDVTELAAAKDQLRQIPGAQVNAIPCDVTDNAQVKMVIERTNEHFGGIDVWINNAGAITVGPFESMDERDFEAQLNLHLRAVIGITQLLVPYFRPRGGGRIININSIGGVLAVPHLSAYCTSKFAQAGFTNSIAPELARDKIYCTTAYPSLMRTGSPIQAVYKGDHQKEFAWFSASDNAPVLSMSAASAATAILRGAAEGRTEVFVGLPAKIGNVVHANFPETFAWSLRAVARMLPNRQSHARRTGADIRALGQGSVWAQRLSWISARAERDLNQHEKTNAEYNLGHS